MNLFTPFCGRNMSGGGGGGGVKFFIFKGRVSTRPPSQSFLCYLLFTSYL
jgi:hypothetical protein